MEILEGHNKFYVNDAQGNQVAEIVFVPTGEHLSIIEHTDVDPSLKGQGVGKQLVAKVVEKMRQEQRKIIPLCPFAKHEFDNTRTLNVSPDRAGGKSGGSDPGDVRAASVVKTDSPGSDQSPAILTA